MNPRRAWQPVAGISRHALLHSKGDDPPEPPQGVAAGSRISRHALVLAPEPDPDQGPPRQWSIRWWSGLKPLFTPQSTAWVRLATLILR